MMFGLVIVLFWIGVMKFIVVEVCGIELLIQISLFFFWMLNFMEIQVVFYIIGVIEIVIVLFLFVFGFNRGLYVIGFMMVVVIFIIMLFFLFSFFGSWLLDFGGFFFLSGVGIFLIKDLVLLVICVVLGVEFFEYWYG